MALRELRARLVDRRRADALVAVGFEDPRDQPQDRRLVVDAEDRLRLVVQRAALSSSTDRTARVNWSGVNGFCSSGGSPPGACRVVAASWE